jgi:hypothetical protein
LGALVAHPTKLQLSELWSRQWSTLSTTLSKDKFLTLLIAKTLPSGGICEKDEDKQPEDFGY